MVPRASVIIAAAAAAIGIEEEPRGSNNGLRLRELLADTRFMPGDAWCMFFAEHCLNAAFDNEEMPEYICDDGSCIYQGHLANQAGKLSPYPATGCVFLLKGLHGFHHAGVVVLIEPGGQQFHTIEGNTNDDGSPNGYGVFRHVRKTADCSFVIW